MRKNIVCVYLIENIVNGKKYIGQTVDYERRVKEHQTRYKKENLKEQRSFLYRAMRKHGLENFHFSILEECSPKELNDLEKKYIDEYGSAQNSYNMTAGGQNDKPNRKIAKEDVVFLRKLYQSKTKMSQEEIWKKYFEDKITFTYFRNLWRGLNWQEVMPEVFTEENINYYRKKATGSFNKKASFSDEEVLQLRNRYKTETTSSIYDSYSTRISLRGMEALLRGQTYQHLPIYKKREKKWINSKNLTNSLEENNCEKF